MSGKIGARMVGLLQAVVLMSVVSGSAVAADPAPPGPPLGLVALLNGNDAELMWQAPVDDGGSPVVEYRVYRAAGAGAASLVGSTVGTAFTDALAPAFAPELYTYTVTAVNSVGEGAAGGPAAAPAPYPCVFIGLLPPPPGIVVHPFCLVTAYIPQELNPGVEMPGMLPEILFGG